MEAANGNGHHGENKARLVFWEVTKGMQPSLHSLPCHRHRAEFPTDLATKAALGIIDQIAGAANPILVLSGGEPLYRSDLFQLARYATDKGLRVALATNGTLVTKDIARMIVDAGVRRVSISLDGADAATHDAFRGIPERSMLPFTASVILRPSACRCRSTRPSRATTRISCPPFSSWPRDLGADALHALPARTRGLRCRHRS